MSFFSRLTGYRTLIVNAVLVAIGALRVKFPDKIPDDGTVLVIINAILDGVFSVPGAGIINILMRIFLTKTPVPGTKPA